MKSAHSVVTLLTLFALAGCGGSVAAEDAAGSGGKDGGKGGAPSSGGADAGASDAGIAGAGGTIVTGGSGGTSSLCTGLDEPSCVAAKDKGCRADYCPCPGVIGFVGCHEANDPPPPCPGSCPLMPCTTLATVDACLARNDCHAVFMPGECGCAACCCVIYSHCADGLPNCEGTATCEMVTPDCANPYCNGEYAIAYANGCYEGCVLTKQCVGP